MEKKAAPVQSFKEATWRRQVVYDKWGRRSWQSPKSLTSSLSWRHITRVAEVFMETCTSGQSLPRNLRVRFPKALRRAHPLGTRFLSYAKLSDKEGGNEFVHTNHAWDVQVLGPPPAGDDLKYK
jgi:hypothetical protein